MELDLKEIVKQLDEVLTETTNSLSVDLHKSKDEEFHQKYAEVTAALSLTAHTICRLAPQGDSFRDQFDQAAKRTSPNDRLAWQLGILRTMKFAYEKGYLQTIEELIHSDLFADFLSQAEYLHREGYKDPAAVLAGGVVEEHLRKLCAKLSIAPSYVDSKGKAQFLMIEAMNQELYKQKVYGKTELAQLTLWSAIRNSAAHGKYGDYTADQVELMIQGVRLFLARFPV